MQKSSAELFHGIPVIVYFAKAPDVA